MPQFQYFSLSTYVIFSRSDTADCVLLTALMVEHFMQYVYKVTLIRSCGLRGLGGLNFEKCMNTH